MFYGYVGQILEIDLSSNEILKKPLDRELIKRFIGGMGFSSWLLYQRVPPSIEAMDSENIILFATGPLTGTLAPCSSRTEITTKSPLTGILGSANVGGFWGPMLKYAGYDLLIVKGMSRSPVYVSIDDERVEIRSANNIWGKDTWETEDLIRKELGNTSSQEMQVLSIGPAGENLVRYAALTTGYFNSASRCGIGAVMGAKKLKAITVRGRNHIKIANPSQFEMAVQKAIHRIRTDPGYDEVTIPGPLEVSNRLHKIGGFPGLNYQIGYFNNWAETRSTEVAVQYIENSPNARLWGKGCHCCPMACYRFVNFQEGKFAGLKLSGLFVAFLHQWGAQCGITSWPAIWKCEELLQRLGLDLCSTAATIAFAFELYQRGIIDKHVTGDLPLRWGDEDAVFELIYQIAYRKGFGNVLAEGSVRASHEIGKEAEKYVMAIKGSEIMGSDPRTRPRWWGFGIQVSLRGADNMKTTHAATFHPGDFEKESRKLGITEEEYLRRFIDHLDIFPEIKSRIFGTPPQFNPHSYQGVAAMTKWYEEVSSVINALGLCLMDQTMLKHKSGPTYYSQMLSSCIGKEITPRDLMEIGERIYNLQKMYLVIHGFSRKDDDWPDRFYEEGIPEGPSKGAVLHREEIDQVLDDYYALRGWNYRGIPKKETLTRLGLQELIEDLPKG
jgi:aldehyde:ferredoxin oxidoreductase